MGAMHVKSPERRDRLWLINAFAVMLLTLLGAAGEVLGYDRMLKTNTVKPIFDTCTARMEVKYLISLGVSGDSSKYVVPRHGDNTH